MPASTRRRGSDLLFRWCPLEMGFDYQGNPYAVSSNKVITGTSDRGGTVGSASSVDVNGRVFVPGYKSARWHHSYDSTTGLFLPRGVLLEGSRTNKVVQSQALATTWTATNCTPANAVGTYAGLSFSRVTGIGATSTLYQAVSMTGDATKSWYFYAKSNGVAGDLSMIWYDSSAPATRRSMLLTVSAAGVVTCTNATVSALADGVYKVETTVPSVVAANTNNIYLVNNSASNTITSILLTGIQAEDATFPSSYIPTTTAAVTRSADALSFAFNAVPQAMTVYADFIESGTEQINSSGIFSIGGVTNPALFLAGNQPKYGLYHRVGSDVTSIASTSPTIGQRVELRAVLSATGTVTLGQTINAGTEAVAATSSALALATAWSNTTLTIGTRGPASEGFGAFTAFKIAPGTKTLAQMRAA